MRTVIFRLLAFKYVILQKINFMKKYSREQVKAMSQSEYESLICEELNNAGFRHCFHNEEHKYFPSDSVFGGAIVFDLQAVEYLKQIGLLNNGKCPMCSVKEDELDYKLQWQRSGAICHVCKSCYKEYATQERAKRGMGCCLIVLVIIVLIIWGIVKLIS